MNSIGLSTFIINKLSVQLDVNTNVAGSNTVQLTSKLIVLSNDEEDPIDRNKLETFPYITPDYKYPDTLYSLPYNEIVLFFFNKQQFKDTMDVMIANTESVPNKGDYFKSNVMTMLELLFPTKFPVINDIHKSTDIINKQLSSRPFFFNVFTPRRFSYLQLKPGTEYTVKKVVWLNDILNHPLYNDLIAQYNEFRNWANSELKKNPSNEEKQKIENYFKKTYGQNKSDGPLPIEYNKFAFTVLNKYRKPNRTSSNDMLQKLINGEKETTTTAFFELLDNIDIKFLNPKSGDNNLNNKLLNVGVDEINFGSDDKPTREIYVMIDLFEGKITDDNVRDVFCPYIGDHLGKRIELLLQPAGLSRWWDVKQKRSSFAFANNNKSDKTIEINARPLQTESNKNEIIIDTNVKNKFDTEILGNSNTLSKSQAQLAKEFPSLLTTSNFNDLYTFLNTYKLDEAPDMGEIVRTWSKQDARNNNLIEKIIKYKSSISGLISINNNRLETTDMMTDANRAKIALDTGLYNLYSMVLDEILKSERKKQLPINMVNGGKLKTRKLYKRSKKRGSRKRIKK